MNCFLFLNNFFMRQKYCLDCNRCKTKMKLSSCQETSTANILFKPVGTGFGDELLRLVIFGDQIDNITSSIVADSVENKLLSIDKVHLCVNNNNVVYSASISSLTDSLP